MFITVRAGAKQSPRKLHQPSSPVVSNAETPRRVAWSRQNTPSLVDHCENTSLGSLHLEEWDFDLREDDGIGRNAHVELAAEAVVVAILVSEEESSGVSDAHGKRLARVACRTPRVAVMAHALLSRRGLQ